MTMHESKVTLKIKKSYTSDISKENQQAWAKIESLPNRIEQVDKDRVQVLYKTDNKSFYCQRLLALIDGNLYYRDILIHVIVHNSEPINKDFLESQIKKEPKKFQKIIMAMIKGYSIIKLGKEVFSKYSSQEEILQKYKSAKRIFEDYLEIIKESL